MGTGSSRANLGLEPALSPLCSGGQGSLQPSPDPSRKQAAWGKGLRAKAENAVCGSRGQPVDSQQLGGFLISVAPPCLKVWVLIQSGAARCTPTGSTWGPAYFLWAAEVSWPLGMNLSELLKIQKRDCPLLGPSFRNSWPSPLPHRPQDTFKASGLLCSGRLATLSAWMVSVKAGHGDECAYLERLEKSS